MRVYNIGNLLFAALVGRSSIYKKEQLVKNNNNLRALWEFVNYTLATKTAKHDV